MEVNSANGSAVAAGGINRTSADNNSAQFLQLLTTQLANQNPLEPISDSDFTGQLSQLSQIEATEKQSSLLEQIALSVQTTNILQGLGQASVLIDKSVSYISGGIEKEGVVQSVRFEGGGIQLELDGAVIGLGDIVSVASQQFAPDADSTEAPTIIPVDSESETDSAADSEDDNATDETEDTADAG